MACESHFKDFKYEEVLGHGSFAVVYRASNGSEQRAIKRIDVKMLHSKFGSSIGLVQLKNLTQQEIDIHRTLNHDNVVRLLDYDQLQGGLVIRLAMEFCQFELEDFMKKMKDFRDESTLDVTTQLCTGLSYLHTNQVAHRDLKPSNILVTFTHNNTPIYKISDFGVSKQHMPSSLTHTFCGTPRFRAPEMFRSSSGQLAYDPFLADVYALGLIVYWIVTGHYLFNGSTEQMLMQQVQNHQSHQQVFNLMNTTPSKHGRISRGAKALFADIVSNLTFVDPAKRASLSNVHKALIQCQKNSRMITILPEGKRYLVYLYSLNGLDHVCRWTTLRNHISFINGSRTSDLIPYLPIPLSLAEIENHLQTHDVESTTFQLLTQLSRILTDENDIEPTNSPSTASNEPLQLVPFYIFDLHSYQDLSQIVEFCPSASIPKLYRDFENISNSLRQCCQIMNQACLVLPYFMAMFTTHKNALITKTQAKYSASEQVLLQINSIISAVEARNDFDATKLAIINKVKVSLNSDFQDLGTRYGSFFSDIRTSIYPSKTYSIPKKWAESLGLINELCNGLQLEPHISPESVAVDSIKDTFDLLKQRCIRFRTMTSQTLKVYLNEVQKLIRSVPDLVPIAHYHHNVTTQLMEFLTITMTPSANAPQPKQDSKQILEMQQLTQHQSSEIKQQEQTIGRQKAEIEQLQQQVLNLNRSLHSKNENVMELSRQLNDISDNLKDSQFQGQLENQGLRDQIKSLKSQISHCQQELETSQKNQQEMLREKDEEQVCLNESIKSMRQKIQQQEQLLHQTQLEAQNLKTQIEQYRDRSVQLESALVDATRSIPRKGSVPVVLHPGIKEGDLIIIVYRGGNWVMLGKPNARIDPRYVKSYNFSDQAEFYVVEIVQIQRADPNFNLIVSKRDES